MVDIIQDALLRGASLVDPIARKLDQKDVALVTLIYVEFGVHVFAHAVGQADVLCVGVVVYEQSAARRRRRDQDGRYVVVDKVLKKHVEVVIFLFVVQSSYFQTIGCGRGPLDRYLVVVYTVSRVSDVNAVLRTLKTRVTDVVGLPQFPDLFRIQSLDSRRLVVALVGLI